tara:strand:- start:228 stop:446 length:219 start_codon:yes stop_codon:yes gene_type:complete
VHHFILQLDKNISADDCIIALDNFMSDVIEYQCHNPTDPQYLFFPKSKLLGFLTSKIRHVQTNSHLFLVISE